MNTFLEYLVKRLIETEVVNLAHEHVGSSKVLAGNVSYKQMTSTERLISPIKDHLIETERFGLSNFNLLCIYLMMIVLKNIQVI